MKNATANELKKAVEYCITDAEIRTLKRVKAKLDWLRQLEHENTLRQFDDLTESEIMCSRLRLSTFGKAQHYIDETIDLLQ